MAVLPWERPKELESTGLGQERHKIFSTLQKGQCLASAIWSAQRRKSYLQQENVLKIFMRCLCKVLYQFCEVSFYLDLRKTSNLIIKQRKPNAPTLGEGCHILRCSSLSFIFLSTNDCTWRQSALQPLPLWRGPASSLSSPRAHSKTHAGSLPGVPQWLTLCLALGLEDAM